MRISELRIEKLVILNVPHPLAMVKYAKSHFEQMRKSWYIAMFQLPILPELGSRLGNWKIIIDTMKRSAKPGTFSEQDFDQYRKAWSRSNSFHYMINWYRGIFQAPVKYKKVRVRVPTRIIWGDLDQFLSTGAAQLSLEYCDDADIIHVEDASHWINHEKPKLVSNLILQFIRSSST